MQQLDRQFLAFSTTDLTPPMALTETYAHIDARRQSPDIRGRLIWGRFTRQMRSQHIFPAKRFGSRRQSWQAAVVFQDRRRSLRTGLARRTQKPHLPGAPIFKAAPLLANTSSPVPPCRVGFRINGPPDQVGFSLSAFHRKFLCRDLSPLQGESPVKYGLQ